MINTPSALPQFIQPDQMPTGYLLSPVTGLFSIEDGSGNVTNLNTLFAQVIGFTGGGLPPIQNLTIPYGQLGGSFYQRTTVSPRVFTLVCIVERNNLYQLNNARKTLMAIVKPNSATQQAAVLYIRYCTTNYKGTAIGTTLRVAVNYVSGLEGNIDNLYQEKIALQFVEYQPPSIKELSATNSSLTGYTNSPASYQLATRTEATGIWTSAAIPTVAGKVITGASDPDGTTYWIGTTAGIYRTDGTAIQATDSQIEAIAAGYLNNSSTRKVFAGGAFTSPNNYLMSSTGGAWSSAVGTINAAVYGLAFDPNNAGSQTVYAVGAFTTPTGRVAKSTNGTSWSVVTGGAGLNNTAYCIARGLDGNFYIGGSFTTADGNAYSTVVRYNPVTQSYSSCNTGTVTGVVKAIAVGPDGRIYVGGTLSSIGGLTVGLVAVYNGTSWGNIGPGGLGGGTTIYRMGFDRYGKLHITGDFIQTAGTIGVDAYYINRYAIWDGQNYLQGDLAPVTQGFGLPDRTNSTSMVIGVNNSEMAATTIVNYTGTAPAYPTFTFGGPNSSVPVLIDYLAITYADPSNAYGFTSKKIYLQSQSIFVYVGETATIVFGSTGIVSFTTSYGRNLLPFVMSTSDVTGFALVPGTNYVQIWYETFNSANVTMSYYNTHFSFDASAA